MKIQDDKRTVKIAGECKEKEIAIELSILQLAKLWNSDKQVLEKLDDEIFGSEELEYECKETRNIVSNFQNINFMKNEIKCVCISAGEYEPQTNTIKILGEDLNGWNNEGILIFFPKELYSKELEGKDFDFILKEDSIELRTK